MTYPVGNINDIHGGNIQFAETLPSHTAKIGWYELPAYSDFSGYFAPILVGETYLSIQDHRPSEVLRFPVPAPVAPGSVIKMNVQTVSATTVDIAAFTFTTFYDA